jgi:isoleucyl-tRNA synthetase
MPKNAELRNVQSVHLLIWEAPPEEWGNEKVKERFALLAALRPHVLKALEEKRRTGEIGSSLEAKVIFKTASLRDLEYLNQNIDMLPAAFIVSQVEVREDNTILQGLSEEFTKTEIIIEQADGQKCSRCWNYKTDLGSDAQHPTLCHRCTAIVKEFI